MIRRAFHTLGELLLTAGVLLLLFAGWQLWWTDVEAARDQQAITEALQEQWGADRAEPAGTLSPPTAPSDTAAPTPPVPAPAEPPTLPEPTLTEPFGIVHVPRFGDGHSVPAQQGVALKAVLNRGVLGHYPGTAMPGGVGNFALAGHRVTYGRPLHRIADLEPGDPIVVETADAWYVYRVRDSQVVAPHRVDVVAAVPGDPAAVPTERLLTLTACHPLYSARQRYVVHAVLDGWQPRSAGRPALLAG